MKSREQNVCIAIEDLIKKQKNKEIECLNCYKKYPQCLEN